VNTLVTGGLTDDALNFLNTMKLADEKDRTEAEFSGKCIAAGNKTPACGY